MKRKNTLNNTAQTQLDFVIGISIFLIAFTMVLVSSGTLLQPFTSGQEDIALSDRIADKVTNTHLTTGERQYVLDKECTVTFFSSLRNNSALVPPEDCRYSQIDANATLNDIFGTKDVYYINITIENTNGKIVTMNGTKLAAGDLPDTGTITLSQRTVRIENQYYYVYVRVV